MAEPRVVAYNNTGCEFNFGIADDIFANVVGPPSAQVKPERVKMKKKNFKQRSEILRDSIFMLMRIFSM